MAPHESPPPSIPVSIISARENTKGKGGRGKRPQRDVRSAPVSVKQKSSPTPTTSISVSPSNTRLARSWLLQARQAQHDNNDLPRALAFYRRAYSFIPDNTQVRDRYVSASDVSLVSLSTCTSSPTHLVSPHTIHCSCRHGHRRASSVPISISLSVSFSASLPACPNCFSPPPTAPLKSVAASILPPPFPYTLPSSAPQSFPLVLVTTAFLCGFVCAVYLMDHLDRVITVLPSTPGPEQLQAQRQVNQTRIPDTFSKPGKRSSRSRATSRTRVRGKVGDGEATEGNPQRRSQSQSIAKTSLVQRHIPVSVYSSTTSSPSPFFPQQRGGQPSPIRSNQPSGVGVGVSSDHNPPVSVTRKAFSQPTPPSSHGLQSLPLVKLMSVEQNLQKRRFGLPLFESPSSIHSSGSSARTTSMPRLRLKGKMAIPLAVESPPTPLSPLSFTRPALPRWSKPLVQSVNPAPH
ncbi:hypothetical protein BDP27DRAFT_1328016 [Rhodocollybia butyracea]|uniref:Uncharacterized protein n=1 Tax=Rhodocollybia butyracea TaxID=206335 RepID=A0A9P5PR75_9AGAR|nr:hypothetical protein BDP27DRAFT_1328016 [Rhodocollybia butyracea]